MEKKNKVFIICFLLILVVFCYSPRMAWAAPASHQVMKDLQEVDRQEPPIMVINVPRIEYTADDLRDPFEPEPVKEDDDGDGEELMPPAPAPLPHLDVQGIVWGSELPQAIINNQVVKIGDMIQDVRVVDISKKGITVFYSGRQQLIASPAANMLGEQSPEPEGGLNEEVD